MVLICRKLKNLSVAVMIITLDADLGSLRDLTAMLPISVTKMKGWRQIRSRVWVFSLNPVLIYITQHTQHY